MHTEKREDPLVDMGYEIRDINVVGIRKSVFWFLGFAVFCSIVGGMVLAWIRGMVVSHEQPASLMGLRRIPGAPNPLLQSNITAKTDIMVLRQNEDRVLYGAPTVNRDGTMRIPIDQAMAIIAAKAATDTRLRQPAPFIPANAASGSKPVNALGTFSKGNAKRNPASATPGATSLPGSAVPGRPSVSSSKR